MKRDFPQQTIEEMTIEQQVVDVIPLDQLDLVPDIVKIDAEGFDYEVLLGLEKTITKSRPHIMVEYGSEIIDNIEHFFQNKAYTLLIYDNDLDSFLIFNKTRELNTFFNNGLQVNLFCIPTEKLATIPVAVKDSCV